MDEKWAALLTAVIVLPILALLIYYAFRNLFASVRNVRDVVRSEMGRQPPTATATPPGPASTPLDPTAELLASIRADAKRSDDARKARIRAHVERPLPPLDDDGRRAIARGLSARLAIKHVFPPRLPRRSMSYLGGLPIVPEEFDWPTIHNRDGRLEPLTFMAQVDCSDLPPGPARDLLPATGYLYFFAPMSMAFGPDAMHFVARYEPRTATQTWEPVDMPFTGRIEPGDRMDLMWRGERTHYDQVQIAFGWIAEPTDEEVAARAEEGYAFEVAEKMRAERVEAFFGPPLTGDGLTLTPPRPAPKGELWVPYPGFPINWKTARILRRFVEAYHREETEDVADKLKALGDRGADDAETRRLRALQTELSVFSLKMGNAFFPTINAGLKESDAPPPEVKRQILAFLDELRVTGMPSSKERPYHHLALPLVLNQWLSIAAIHGAEAGLADSAGAALIPPEVVEALRHRHTARGHQMLGEGIVVQVAADEMKDRYLLLLQLGPDRALDWTVGEMGPLQYWITPEDLAAKRFEHTVLTIEAY